VSLAAELPFAEIVATDNSLAALALPKMPHSTKRGSNHIFTRRLVRGGGGVFDLIVSEPPYIRRAEIATRAGSHSGEPRGVDGGAMADCYRRIAAEAWRFLTPDGALALEIGADMGGQVCALFNQAAVP
jgi:release factor glutamine methyltransferase